MGGHQGGAAPLPSSGTGGMLFRLRGHVCSPQDPNLLETTIFNSAGTKPCQVSVQTDERLHSHKEGAEGYLDRAGDRGAWVEHTTSFSRLMLRRYLLKGP